MTGESARPSSPPDDALDARLGRGLGWILIGIVILMARLLLPQPPAPPELDPSWQQGLSYALAHGFQFGRDILFTFGPLGGIAHARYQPELYWIQIIGFELLFKGLLIWRWIVAMRRFPHALDRAVFVLMLVVSELGADAFYFATTVVIASLQLDEPAPSRKRLTLDFLLLAVIAFIKFTYFMLVGGVVAMVIARFALRSRRRGLETFGIYCGCILAVWSLCGQAPWNLPIWIARAATIASGYSEAQAMDGDFSEVALGIGWIVLLLVIAGLTVIGSAQRALRALASVVVLGGAYVAFKASFTYHSAHGITFFGFAGLALCALVPPSDASPARRILLGVARAVAIVVCVAGLSLRYQSPEEMVGHTFGEGTQHLLRTEQALAKLPSLRETLEQQRVRRGIAHDLPQIRDIVGESEADLLSSSQARLFLNRLNWKPRPVFQSYITVAPNLIAMNERFLSSDEAPEFMLLELGGIDERLSGMEDSGSLRALMHGYAPVAVERGIVLLRRDPLLAARPPPKVEVVNERDIRPGEVVRLGQIPGKALRVRFDIRYNALGKLRKLLYHAPITYIELKCQDGQVLRCRLLPGMVQSSVMLRPYIQGNDDWVRLYTRGVDKAVRAFSIESSSDWDALYEPEIHMVIERCDEALPVPDVKRELELAFGCFGSQPVYASSATEVRSFPTGRGDVALVGPLSRVAFELTPGAHELSGRYGMLPESIGRSDGVDFEVAIISKEGRRSLFRHTLVPRDESEASAPLELRFEAEDGDRLVLVTGNPPERNIDFDLAWWTAIKLE